MNISNRNFLLKSLLLIFEREWPLSLTRSPVLEPGIPAGFRALCPGPVRRATTTGLNKLQMFKLEVNICKFSNLWTLMWFQCFHNLQQKSEGFANASPIHGRSLIVDLKTNTWENCLDKNTYFPLLIIFFTGLRWTRRSIGWVLATTWRMASLSRTTPPPSKFMHNNILFEWWQ